MRLQQQHQKRQPEQLLYLLQSVSMSLPFSFQEPSAVHIYMHMHEHEHTYRQRPLCMYKPLTAASFKKCTFLFNLQTLFTTNPIAMSISDFRKKKLMFLFNVFFDVNQSGEIDVKDFELAIERVCKLRGWEQNTPKNQETHAVMLEIWEGLRSKADKDNDGQVSVDEWCNMWDTYAKNPSSVMDWQNKYMNFMFDLEDASNDGGIDVQEFALVCSSYGLDKKECEEAFKKMALGKAEVTREHFAALWKEYFAAEDVNAPGNFIFGKTTF